MSDYLNRSALKDTDLQRWFGFQALASKTDRVNTGFYISISRRDRYSD